MPEPYNAAKNGWSEWSRYVLKELERLNSELEKANNSLSKLREDVVTLNVKSSLWGAASGAIAVILMSLARNFFK